MSKKAPQTPPSDLMEVLMRDPVKRALVMQLLTKEKDNFESYKRRMHCESPTALQRRRALDLLNNKDNTSDKSDSSSSEVMSEASEAKGPKLPFDQLLKGVKAYVEVKKDNVDRSEGIKAVMRMMGATIRDNFTKDVTHVVYKDGSYSTYEKAKLIDAHLVSVLWLDAVRRNNARVPEKNYPAFGNRVCDSKVSILCSQLQKDYEEVIKDEKRRSLSALPNTSKSFDKNRRKTIISASQTNLFGAKPVASDMPRDRSSSPELTSDDSDCAMVDGETSSKRSTDILQDSLESSFLESSGSKSLLSRASARNRRKTTRVVSDMQITPNVVVNTPQRSESNAKRVLHDSTKQGLMTSMDSDRTKSGLGTQSEARSSKDKENCSLTTAATTMSSLRISDSFEREEKDKGRRSKSSSRTSSNRSPRASSQISPKTPTEHNTNKKKQTKEKASQEESTGNPTEVSRSVSPPATKKKTSQRAVAQDRRSRSVSSSATKAKASKKRSSSPSQVEDEHQENLSSPAKRNKKKSMSPRRSPTKAKNNKSETVPSRLRRTRSVSQLRTEEINTTPRAVRGSSVSVLSSVNRRNLPATTRRSRRLSSRSISRSESEDGQSGNDRTISDSPTKKSRLDQTVNTSKKKRKLYTPSEMCTLSPESDKEREEYIQRKTGKKNTDGVFLNPNDILIAPAPPSKKQTKQSDSDTTSNWSSDEIDDPRPKKTKKKQTKRKEKTPPLRRDSAADEQRELLNLLTKKTSSEDEEVRRSQRVPASQTKPKYCFTSSSESQPSDSLAIVPDPRRSSLYFVRASQQQKVRLKLDVRKQTSIVCTRLHKDEVVNFGNIVQSLGMFYVQDNVTNKTTHLVAGESKRTLNMLRAIARGCWVVRHEWLLKSREEGKWQDEESYEVLDFSPAVQKCRLQRQAFGPRFTMDVFKDFGPIYVAKSTTPKASDLKELIAICQGHLTTCLRSAAVVVGEFIPGKSVPCVKETWVLDCITHYRLQPLKNYFIKENSPNF